MANKEKRVVFFERSSWYHRTKELQEDGTVKYSKKGGFKSPEEAEESYWKYEEEFKQQQRKYQAKQSDNANILLGDYLRYWFEEVFTPRIETTTRMIGAYTLYNQILPSMENDIRLQYMTVQYVDELLARIATICPSAGNKARELLSIAMKDAVSDGIVKENVMPQTKPYKRRKPKVRILSKKNIIKLLSAVSKSPWYLEIMLALFCGLRKGEILGLKFEDFDTEKKTVRISRQIVANPVIKKGFKIDEYTVVERDPKTENSFRVLRVPDAVLEELERRKKRIELEKEYAGKDYEDNGYVCCQMNGRPHSLSAFNIALTKLCKRNGLPVVTVHGLRHMFATILVERGVPLVKISGLLGHSSVHTTYEYYCDVMDETDMFFAFLFVVFSPVAGEEEDGLQEVCCL